LKVKLLVAAAAVVALCGAASAGAAKSSGITMHLIEKDTGFNFVDNKPYGPGHTASIGDMFAFSASLLTRANKHAGSLVASCIVASGGKHPTYECTGSFSLAGGQLELQTAMRDGTNPTHIAIVGGTGAYEGVRGSVTSVSRGENSPYSDDTIHLLPKGF